MFIVVNDAINLIDFEGTESYIAHSLVAGYQSSTVNLLTISLLLSKCFYNFNQKKKDHSFSIEYHISKNYSQNT